MKIFYIDKGMVAHVPDIILEHGWAFMIQWKNSEIIEEENKLKG